MYQPYIYASGAGARTVIVIVLTVTLPVLIAMHSITIIAALITIAQARPGLIFNQHLAVPGIVYAQSGPSIHPHPAVELNAANEALLPPELLKSNSFYSDPAIASGLAKESWFTKKEMQVVKREAEKIPRQRIYDIVKNAGFI